MKRAPSFEEEMRLWAQAYWLVAGVDEVGRGPLAGPVVAAAVILPPWRQASWLTEVRDSKELTPRQREVLAELIRREALAIGLGVVPPEVIDASGIIAATRLAMCQAVKSLPSPPDFLLIDALELPEAGVPYKSIVKGDGLSLSIACASIVAKAYRDRLMQELDARYPGYGFARNKGYATPEHLAALKRLRPCPIHRRSFEPVARTLTTPEDDL